MMQLFILLPMSIFCAFSENELQVGQKIPRRTLSKQTCLKQWKLGSQIVHGCSSQISPDSSENRPWCRIQNREKMDPKDWDYCEEALDFDEVRQAVHEAYQEDVKLINSLSSGFTSLVPIINTALEKGDFLTKEQKAMGEILNTFTKKKKDVLSQIDIISKVQTTITNKIDQIKTQKEENSGVHIPQNVGTFCQGMEYYPEALQGDGFQAVYFKNEHFLGEGVKLQEKNLIFEWDRFKHPAPGVSQNSFSAVFKGYLLAPLTDDYQFYLESDQAISFTFNNQLLIDHFILDRKKGHENQQMGDLLTSQPIGMNSEALYSFEVKYWRSDSVLFNVPNKRFIRVKWSSSKLKKQNIPEQNLFQTIKDIPFIITEYKQQDIHLTYLRDWDRAFQDTPHMVLSDVPQHYSRAKFLRLQQKFSKKEISFRVNKNIDLYIAIPREGKQKPPKDFIDQQESLSLLYIAKPEFQADKSYISKQKPIYSLDYRIYMKENQKQGDITIPVSHVGESYLLWVTEIIGQNHKQSCGGVIQSLDKNHQDYLSCIESDSQENNFCESVFQKEFVLDSKLSLTPVHSLKQFLELQMKIPYQFIRLSYLPNINLLNNIRTLVVKFDDQSEIQIKPKILQETQMFELPRKISQTLRITILNFHNPYTQITGKFKVEGHPCQFLESNEERLLDKTFSFNCGQTLFNHPQLILFRKEPGQTLKIRCKENCQNKAVVYGSESYYQTSEVCAMKSHAGGKNSLFSLQLVTPSSNYQGTLKNGIQSLDKHEPGLFGMQLKSEETFQPFVGFLVDVQIDSIWQQGLVLEVLQDGIMKIEVDGEKIQRKWGDKELTFCGKMIKERECDERSQDVYQSKLFSLNVCFSLDFCEHGFIADQGLEIKNRNGFTFGWNVPNVLNIKCGNTSFQNENEKCAALFTERHKKSCKSKKNQEQCKPRDWKIINLPKGNYKVTVGIFDEYDSFINELWINGEPIVKKMNQKLHSKLIKSKEITIDGGSLTLSDNCETNCENNYARVSFIQIEQLKEKEVPKEPGVAIEWSLGLKSGGVCDDLTSKEVNGCVYEDLNGEVSGKKLQLCVQPYQMIQIPENNLKARDLRKKLVCILKQFRDQKSCWEHCPLDCIEDHKVFLCKEL